MSDQGGDMFKGFLLGGILGAALGVLFAPKSGKDIRGNLKGESDELLDKAKEELEKIKKELNDLGGKISETIEKGKGIFEEKTAKEESEFEEELQSGEEEEKPKKKTTRRKRTTAKNTEEA